MASAVDCAGSVADYEARTMEDAEVMDVVGTLLAAAISRTRICIRTTQVRTSRRLDTVDHMMGGILVGTVVVMVRGVTRRSPVNKSWFAM